MNLKIARIKAGLTQRQLAQKAGLSNVTIVKIEKGNYKNINVSTMLALAKALNSDVQTLFFSDEE